MKKILLILSFLLTIFFLSSNKTYAIISYLGPNQTAANSGYTINPNTSDCGPQPPQQCATSNTYSSSPCSTFPGCTLGANPWSKYTLDPNCYFQTGSLNSTWLYDYNNATCSIADKCGDANGNNAGPTLNAGFCDCTVGGTFKTCCAGTNVSPNSCVQQIPPDNAPFPPYNGVCPTGTTTVPCGSDPSIYAAMGYPFTNVTCGQAACAGSATPPPTTSTTCPGATAPVCPNGASPTCPNGYIYGSDSAGNKVCINRSTGQPDCNVKPYCSKCPNTNGWTGLQCSGPSSPNLAQACATDTTTCNKCSSAVCTLYDSSANLYCYYNNTSACYIDSTFCKGFGSCGTCTPGSTKIDCSAPNVCQAP